MGLTETVYASGKIISLLLVPILRELAAVLLAFAIGKDCKARDNGSSVLWGLFTLFFPVLSGIVYFLYSRVAVKRDAKTPKDKRKIRSSRRLTVAAVFIYVLSLIAALVAFLTSVASGIALNADDNNKNSFLQIFDEEYYDMNGVHYNKSEDVPIYDEYGNEYHYMKSSNGFNYFTYFDKDNKEYDIERCYISKEGYFYYDENNSLEDTGEFYYYDKHFYDSSGTEYAHIDDYVFWDKNGKIVIHYIKGYRYAFD